MSIQTTFAILEFPVAIATKILEVSWLNKKAYVANWALGY